MNKPVGVIDSGLVGLSVLRHLINDLQSEDFIYFADSSYCPYGKRSFEEIQKRSCLIVDELINNYDVKLIVVACNTITAAAIDLLRAKYSIPFVGMEPAIKPAALNTKTGVIGVLATEGTFNGRLFKETQEKYASDIKVIIRAGNGLVELIEKGITSGNEIESLLNNYIQPMTEQGADLLVLGCTHYPFLTDTVNKMFPNLLIIDPAPAVSRHTVNILKEQCLFNNQNNRKIKIVTTGQITNIQRGAKLFLGEFEKNIYFTQSAPL